MLWKKKTLHIPVKCNLFILFVFCRNLHPIPESKTHTILAVGRHEIHHLRFILHKLICVIRLSVSCSACSQEKAQYQRNQCAPCPLYPYGTALPQSPAFLPLTAPRSPPRSFPLPALFSSSRESGSDTVSLCSPRQGRSVPELPVSFRQIL